MDQIIDITNEAWGLYYFVRFRYREAIVWNHQNNSLW